MTLLETEMIHSSIPLFDLFNECGHLDVYSLVQFLILYHISFPHPPFHPISPPSFPHLSFLACLFPLRAFEI